MLSNQGQGQGQGQVEFQEKKGNSSQHAFAPLAPLSLREEEHNNNYLQNSYHNKNVAILDAVNRIQACYRGFSIRNRLVHKVRKKYFEILQEISNDLENEYQRESSDEDSNSDVNDVKFSKGSGSGEQEQDLKQDLKQENHQPPEEHSCLVLHKMLVDIDNNNDNDGYQNYYENYENFNQQLFSKEKVLCLPSLFSSRSLDAHDDHDTSPLRIENIDNTTAAAISGNSSLVSSTKQAKETENQEQKRSDLEEREEVEGTSVLLERRKKGTEKLEEGYQCQECVRETESININLNNKENLIEKEKEKLLLKDLLWILQTLKQRIDMLSS